MKESRVQNYSQDGFALLDGSVMVVMKNHEEMNDSLFAFLQVKKEKLSEKDIKTMLQVIGYDFKEKGINNEYIDSFID